jgi:hypothetical protein
VKRLILPIVAAVGLALAAVAAAHVFTSSPSLSIAKVPAGATAPGTRIIVYGKIHSGRALCRANRNVRLFRVRPGADRLLATDVTDREGEYSFVLRPRRDRRVYTRISRLSRSSYLHQHVCRADRSRTLFINVS